MRIIRAANMILAVGALARAGIGERKATVEQHEATIIEHRRKLGGRDQGRITHAHPSSASPFFIEPCF